MDNEYKYTSDNFEQFDSIINYNNIKKLKYNSY